MTYEFEELSEKNYKLTVEYGDTGDIILLTKEQLLEDLRGVVEGLTPHRSVELTIEMLAPDDPRE